MNEDKNTPILNPQRINLAEYVRQDWVVNAEEGISVEQVEDPAYWAHTSAKFKPYDHIEVRAEDGAWVAQFIVLDCSRTWARLFKIDYHKLTTSDVSMTQAIKHEVKWKGPQRKYAVIRISDSAVITEGHATQEIAMISLKQHEQVTS